MGVDAASGWILDALEGGEELPKATMDTSAIETEPGTIVNFLVLDMDSFAEKYGNASVRKNLTIPAWLNTAAERENVNFSAVLQQALIQKLNIRKNDDVQAEYDFRRHAKTKIPHA